MATEKWVDQQVVSESDFAQLMASNLRSIYQQPHIDESTHERRKTMCAIAAQHA